MGGSTERNQNHLTKDHKVSVVDQLNNTEVATARDKGKKIKASNFAALNQSFD